jgi:hypothetical protein
MKCLNGNNPLNQCVISFSYYLWHAWRVSCFERRNQNHISVCIAIKSTSKWSPSPGLNSQTPTWPTVQRMTTAGKLRGLSRDLSKQCPDYRTLSYVDRGLGEIGVLAVNRQSRERGRSFRTQQIDEDVLQSLEGNISTSISAVAHEVSVDLRLVWRVVCE